MVVQSIEPVGFRDVYDIEVKDNHNFALSAGIFVHNSKDNADALCGAVFTASKYADQYAYDFGEGLEMMLKVNDGGNPEQIKKQMLVDFEQELLRMSGLNKTPDADKPVAGAGNDDLTRAIGFQNDIMIW